MRILSIALKRANRRHVINIVLFCLFLFFFQLFATYTFLRYAKLSQVRGSIKKMAERIQSDFSFTDGKIDTSRYAADPNTPFPRGSSGFPHPLYIITNDGFVIERNLPIHGFLSTSDFKHISVFDKPTTISPSNNESWRILSVPVRSAGKAVAVIAVSYYAPVESVVADIDEKLFSAAHTLQKGITLQNTGAVIADHIDIRSVPYDIAFEIVTLDNTVIANNGRTPSYIDPSYPARILKTTGFFQVIDDISDDPYLLYSTPLQDQAGVIHGLVVTGEPIKSINDFMLAYIIYSIIVGMVLSAPVAWFALHIIKNDARSIIESYHAALDTYEPNTIIFSPERACITVDSEKISIPYGSNQYIILKSLISKPTKRWETDELLELLGEYASKDGWRKLYDASLAINKKIGLKLIIFKDKTIFINSDYTPRIG